MSTHVEHTVESATPASAVDDQRPLSNVLVGIPAYNEAVGIGSVVLAARRLTDNVVVVDDGSTDGTVELAKRAGALVLQHETNGGKGKAMQTLFEYAATTDHDAVVVLDGDGQHLPEDIPAVVDPVLEDECDLAIGSRYVGGETTETPLYRRVGQKTLDLLTVGSASTELTDTQSGFRALSPAAVDALSLTTDGMGVESEMISDATNKGLAIQEVPIDVRYEGVEGQTYNPVRHGLTVVTFILQLVRDRHPMVFFGLPGVVLLTVGAILGTGLLTVYQRTATVSPATALVTGLVTTVGLLCLFSGLVLNQVANMIQKVQ